MASRGILYVATGSDYVSESITSAEQLRSVMPDVNISLFSDREPDSGVFDSHFIISDPDFDFTDRIRALPRSPYDMTLHIDSDIYVTEPVPELFDVLSDFDLAAALDAHQQPTLNSEYPAQDLYTNEYQPLPEFNGGLIAYNMSPSVKHLFSLWESLYDPNQHWSDQPALRSAIYESDVRICPLPRRYNFIPGLRNSLSGEVKIIHNRLHHDLKLGFKDVPPDQLSKVIKRVNRTDKARVTYPYRGEISHYSDLEVVTQDTLPVQIIKSLFRLGIRDAVRIYKNKLW